MKTYQIKTVKPLRNAFWDMLKEVDTELAKEYRVRKTQNQYGATIRTYWCSFVDSMKKDNQISEKLANRATL